MQRRRRSREQRYAGKPVVTMNSKFHVTAIRLRVLLFRWRTAEEEAEANGFEA